MKLNNKGFAVSIILYSIIAVIILVLLLVLAVYATNYHNKSTLADQIKENISGLNNPSYGDVNLDGVVNNSDVTYLAGYIAGSSGYTLNTAQRKNADVNLDGEIDAKDRMIIARYLDGWEGYTLPYTGG